MGLFELNKTKDGWDNKLVIHGTDINLVELGVVDPDCGDHLAWIDLNKEDVTDLRDFLNKHLQEETTQVIVDDFTKREAMWLADLITEKLFDNGHVDVLAYSYKIVVDIQAQEDA